MSRIIRALALLFLIFALPTAALAQTPDYRLRVSRNIGSQAGSDVRGSFTMSVYGDQAVIQSVTFMMDDKELTTLNQAPFEFKYRTDAYPSGWHDLTAVVTRKDGTKVTTPVVRLNYLSPDQESQALRRIFVPLLGVIGLISVIAMGSQFLLMRGSKRLEPGEARSYGIKGGTICPRCGRAYAVHFFSINLPGGYIDRCDFCGKWAFVRPRSRAELAAAEQAERTALQTSESSLPAAQPESEEERLKKMLDESRYTG